MNNLRFPLLITLFSVMVFVFGSCTDDPCDGVECGANGDPIEDVVFGTCDCVCDTGFTNVPGSGCVSDPCFEVECGLGEATVANDNCFCNCPEGTINNDDGLGCVQVVLCDDSNCINGDCDENGACVCEEGYVDESCATRIVDMWIGTWTSTETCTAATEVAGVCESFTDTYDFTITENGTSLSNVVMNNYFNVDSDGDAYFPTLVADVTVMGIEVTIQASDSPFYNYQSSGSGVRTFDDTGNPVIMYDYLVNELDENGTITCTVNCSATWTMN